MGKKKYFITGLFIILLSGQKLSAAPDILQNYSHYYSYEDKVFTTGLRLGLSMFEGRIFINSEGNYGYGLSVFSDKYLKHFPLSFQAGNLSVGGIISRLNNPLTDSSSSGFSSCYSNPGAITSSLPSYSSFSKPFSTFLELGYKNEGKIIEEILLNGAYEPDNKNLSFSTKLGFNFSENFNLINSLCCSFYPLEEDSSPSWYLDTPYYYENESICFATELGINFWKFFSNFSMYCYKSPFLRNWNSVNNIYKTEHKFESEHFQISASGLFNNSRYLISRDNKVIAPCTQIKSNIQYKTNFNTKDDYSLKIGLTSFGNISALEDEHDFKTGLSSYLKFPLASILLESSLSYIINENLGKMNLTYVSANIENTWNFKNFSPSLGISSHYYISQEYGEINSSKNYKVVLDCNAWNNKINATSSFSFSIKNNCFTNKKINAGLNFNLIYNKILVFTKISAEFCL